MAKAKSQFSANPSPVTPNVSEANPAIPSTSTGAAGCSPDSSPDVTRTRPTPPDKVDNASSNNISISSITEDEDDANVRDDDDGSSAFESSSDSECENEQIKKAIERIPNTLQPGSQLVRLPSAETAAMATAIQERPNIGSIAVQNSSDITFGNKTYIKGQVVIKNIYHDRKATSNGGGVVNEGYRETDGEAGIPSQKKKDLSSQPVESPSWRSSLKTIIRDKPLLSAIALAALMFIVGTVTTVVYVTTSSGKPARLRPHYGDGDDDRAYVPPDTGIGTYCRPERSFLPFLHPPLSV